jgi:hypothetical protein
VLGAGAQIVLVDAYSDFTDQMPADIRSAQERLRARGSAQGDGDPGIGIAIPCGDEVGWALARAYAPWSIRTSLHDADGVSLAIIDDAGHSVTLNLNADEAADLTERLSLTELTAPSAPASGSR